MFNEERKTEFINWYTDCVDIRLTAARVFEYTAKYESKQGVDVCAMPSEIIAEIVHELGGMHERRVSVKLRILRKYAQWCIMRGFPEANDNILSVRPDAQSKITDGMVASPEHLQQIANAVFKPESAEASDNLYRCYIWLLFSGLTPQDIISARSCDVDLNAMTITVGSSEYNIYDYALPSLINCMNLKRFHRTSNKFDSLVPRVEGDLLMRGTDGVPRIHSFTGHIVTLIKAANSAGRIATLPNCNGIWLSGIFYRAYEREIAGFPCDFRGVAEMAIGQRKAMDQLAANYIPARIARAEKDYTRDYEIWKAGFHLN